MFLDLVEIADESAATIIDALLKCTKNYGFNGDYLKANFVSFASDVASVMVGKKSGVASRRTALYPNLITWQCLSLRLELAEHMDSLFTLQSLWIVRLHCRAYG